MRTTALRLIALVSVTLFLFAGTAGECRDWAKDPASVEIPYAARVVAVGDVHGAFQQFAASLDCLGVAKRPIPDSYKLEWTGGKTVLVFTGDFNDRGLYTREVYDAVMDLEEQARQAGGRVVPLLGNHETLLLNGTTEKWANTLKPPKNQHYRNTLDSFTRAGLDFHQAISPTGRYGDWIRRRPLFAVVNGIFFVHGGLGKDAQDRATLVAQYRTMIDTDNWSSGPLNNADASVLWYREWWNDAALVERNLAALGARGCVFGHTVGAMGVEGEVNARDARLVGIDIGMTPAYGKSQGGGLAMETGPDGRTTFTARYPDRPAKELFVLPASAAVRSLLRQPVAAPARR